MFQALPQAYAPQPSPSPPMDNMLLVPETKMVPAVRNGGPKPRKMRASCDACSRAKVKCDKARPVCHRCTNMNMCCNYSPSMRLGKPRKIRNPDDRPVFRDVSPAGSNIPLGPMSDMVTRTNVHTAESSPEPTDPFFFCPATPEYHYPETFMANGFSGCHSPDYSGGSLASGWSNEEQMVFGASPDIFTTMPQYLTSHTSYGGHVRVDSTQSQTEIFPPVEGLHSPPTGVGQFIGLQDPIPPRQDKMMTSPPPMACAPLPTPPLASAPLGTTGHDCTQYAFQILSSLYAPSNAPSATTTNLSGNMDSSPNWNDISSATNSAVEKLYTLLECPCSANPHYSTTIAFSITKILSWHRSVAGVDDHNDTMTATTRMQPFSHTSNPVRKMNPDADSEVNLRTNIVLSELKRVERLINRFSERYCQPAAHATETGIDGGIYGALETQLRTEVRNTFQVIMRTAPDEVKRHIALNSQNRARVHTM